MHARNECIHLFVHWFGCSFINSFTHSLIIHSVSYSCIRSFVRPITRSLFPSSIIHKCIHSCILPSIQPVIRSFVRSFAYPFIPFLFHFRPVFMGWGEGYARKWLLRDIMWLNLLLLITKPTPVTKSKLGFVVDNVLSKANATRPISFKFLTVSGFLREQFCGERTARIL